MIEARSDRLRLGQLDSEKVYARARARIRSVGPDKSPDCRHPRRTPVGRKAQRIDLDLLTPPMKAFPDEPDQGGTKGHIAIAPADDAGEVDVKALEDWASSRETGRVHSLTQILLDAVV